MGWEARKGILYYYRKARDGRHVQSKYMGRGDKAIEASRADGVAVPDEVRGDAALVAQPEVASVRHVKKEDVTQIRHVKKEAQITSDADSSPSLVDKYMRYYRAPPAPATPRRYGKA
jgi:hypothetical protein